MEEEKKEENSVIQKTEETAEAESQETKEENHEENETVHINITKLDEEGLSEFRDALAKSDHEKLNEVYERYEPIDFAQAMEDFNDEEIAQTCALFPISSSARFWSRPMKTYRTMSSATWITDAS